VQQDVVPFLPLEDEGSFVLSGEMQRTTWQDVHKFLLLLMSVVFLTSCNSPKRYAANQAAGVNWLAANTGKETVNITGKWKDVTEDEWGDAHFSQSGHKVKGTIGIYEVDGVVKGSQVHLALKTDNWIYYTVVADKKGDLLEGRYSRGVPFNEKTKARFAFRKER
jgi:hypothetical protein